MNKKKWLTGVFLSVVVLMLSACGYSEEDLTPERASSSNYKEVKGLDLEEVKLIKEKEVTTKNKVKKVSYEHELHAVLTKEYAGTLGIEFASDNVEVTSNAKKNTVDLWVSPEGEVKGVKALYLTKKSYKDYKELVKLEDN